MQRGPFWRNPQILACPAGLLVLVLASVLGAAPAVGSLDDELDLLGDAPVRGFAAFGGQWTVADGILLAAGGPGPRLHHDAEPWRTGEAGVEVFFPDRTAGNAGLVIQVSNAGVGADRFDGYEIALSPAAGHLCLGRHQQNFELIGHIPCKVPVGQWIALAVRITEETLEVSVDGRNIAKQALKNRLGAGTAGLRTWQREARFRKFWIARDGKTQQVAFEGATAGAAPRGDDAWPQTLTFRGLPPVAFVARHPLTAPPAVGQDLWAAQPTAPGCSIRLLDPSNPRGPARTIFADPAGAIYDMNLSFDARTLYFSYRRKDEQHWHLWRIGVDGAGLRQLTDGPYYDVSPCPVPGGDLVFVSTRRFGYTLCQPGPSSNLYRMAPDGGRLRCISMNTLSDMSPQMLSDGRLLFTRWEYIDRDLTYRQSLWTQYPDGAAYQLFFGNTVRDVGTFWQARPLPGRNDRLVATFAPHHGFPQGAIGFIDRSYGLEGPKGKGFRYLTREWPSIGDARQEWAYRDPFPLSDRTLLCSYGGRLNRYRLFLLDDGGRKRLLHEEPVEGCYSPLALRAVREPSQVASQLPPSEPVLPESASEPPMATFLLIDVYRGLTPPIARGQVKYLRVMEQVRKTEDLASRAYDQSPVMSYGTYYAKRCWGTVPIEEDGSAHFRAPALREIYFQVLDAEGRELQRMTSGAQAMPGERISCVGCHEPRGQTPPAGRTPLSARHAPATLERPAWAPDGIVDFPTVVQPVLDRHCVRCHGGSNPDGGCDLSGDKTRYFNMAYDNLLGRSRSYRQHNMDTGEMLPEESARGRPLVHFYWLLRTPTAVNQPLWTGSHASRLVEYLESKHVGSPLPSDDRQRVYAWIDANVPYYATYAHSRPRSPGKRDLWTDPATGQLAAWFSRGFLPVYDRRCATCHGKLDGTIDWEGRYAWINLTRPASSTALTAHMPVGSGGRGIRKPRDGRVPPVLLPTDPDFRAMLSAIEEGRRMAAACPEADMPGFAGKRKEP